MNSVTEDMLLKCLLAFLGAVAGAILKTVADLYRLRALLPIVMSQIRTALVMCRDAYSIEEVRVAEPILDTTFRSLTEMIGLGVRPRKRWRLGAQLLLELSIAARSVTLATVDQALARLEKVRENAHQLEEWFKEQRTT